jgi:ferredoxin
VPGEGTTQVRIDWQACQARGLCHELLPELIALDDWGYPIVSGPVPARLLADAQSAVRACPQLAVTLVRDPRGRRVFGWPRRRSGPG